jgi:acid phosphatase family membrane protein YuiD
MSLWFEIILAPFISMMVVQSIKLAIDGIKGNFTFKDLVTAYGGMPSSHAAVVVSLCTMVAFVAGLDSAVFAVAVVFALIVVSDAITFRKVVDDSSKSIQLLVKRLPPSDQSNFPVHHHNIEHTIPQVIVGSIIGFSIAWLLHLL